MIITAAVWDKKTSINGRSAAFLTEHFKKDNGNDDRIIIAYDGIVMRIEYLDDSRFTIDERRDMRQLIEDGYTQDEAIAKTWEKKVVLEYEQEEARAAKEADSIEKLRADVDYILIMEGLE